MSSGNIEIPYSANICSFNSPKGGKSQPYPVANLWIIFNLIRRVLNYSNGIKTVAGVDYPSGNRIAVRNKPLHLRTESGPDGLRCAPCHTSHVPFIGHFSCLLHPPLLFCRLTGGEIKLKLHVSESPSDLDLVLCVLYLSPRAVQGHRMTAITTAARWMSYMLQKTWNV